MQLKSFSHQLAYGHGVYYGHRNPKTPSILNTTSLEGTITLACFIFYQFIKTGSYYIALADLELAMQTMLALSSEICLHMPGLNPCFKEEKRVWECDSVDRMLTLHACSPGLNPLALHKTGHRDILQ